MHAIMWLKYMTKIEPKIYNPRTDLRTQRCNCCFYNAAIAYPMSNIQYYHEIYD